MTATGTTAIITAKPESADQVEAALTDPAAASNAQEGGIMYSLNRGREGPNRFVTVRKGDFRG